MAVKRSGNNFICGKSSSGYEADVWRCANTNGTWHTFNGEQGVLNMFAIRGSYWTVCFTVTVTDKNPVSAAKHHGHWSWHGLWNWQTRHTCILLATHGVLGHGGFWGVSGVLESEVGSGLEGLGKAIVVTELRLAVIQKHTGGKRWNIEYLQK